MFVFLFRERGRLLGVAGRVRRCEVRQELHRGRGAPRVEGEHGGKRREGHGLQQGWVVHVLLREVVVLRGVPLEQDPAAGGVEGVLPLLLGQGRGDLGRRLRGRQGAAVLRQLERVSVEGGGRLPQGLRQGAEHAGPLRRDLVGVGEVLLQELVVRVVVICRRRERRRRTLPARVVKRPLWRLLAAGSDAVKQEVTSLRSQWPEVTRTTFFSQRNPLATNGRGESVQSKTRGLSFRPCRSGHSFVTCDGLVSRCSARFPFQGIQAGRRLHALWQGVPPTQRFTACVAGALPAVAVQRGELLVRLAELPHAVVGREAGGLPSVGLAAAGQPPLGVGIRLEVLEAGEGRRERWRAWKSRANLQPRKQRS